MSSGVFRSTWTTDSSINLSIAFCWIYYNRFVFKIHYLMWTGYQNSVVEISFVKGNVPACLSFQMKPQTIRYASDTQTNTHESE